MKVILQTCKFFMHNVKKTYFIYCLEIIISNNFYLIPMPIQFSFEYLFVFMFCILMSVIAQLYLIPLISGRHGRPATKLPVRKIIKFFKLHTATSRTYWHWSVRPSVSQSHFFVTTLTSGLTSGLTQPIRNDLRINLRFNPFSHCSPEGGIV